MALLAKTIDIRRGERRRTLIMFSYLFLLLSSYYMLKSMTRSFFLVHQGATQLPIVYMLVAFVVGVVAAIYAKYSAKIRLNRLINYSTGFLIANLILFWRLLSIDLQASWLYYCFYIWVSIYGVLTTTQFWLLANYLFNAREAKRLFPILTVGAILGGIFGGYITRVLVKQIGGTANLALCCMALLGLSLMLVNLAWRCKDDSQERAAKKSSPAAEGGFVQVVSEVFALIRNSRHLAFLMGIIAMTVMVSQIADFQFNTYASKEITQTDDLTEFLGLWLSNLSLISLIFQIVFAGLIIRKFGVGVTIIFLPVAMMFASLWVFVGYGLLSVLTLKISDGAFRYSINKVGIELLFLPIPTEVKKKTKAFVDMFADRLARGIAGILLLVFYTWLGLSVAQISLVTLALVAVWVALGLAMRREYVNSFRLALEKRRIDADLLTTSITDEATINSLKKALASENDRQVVYSLRLLESVRGVDLVPWLRPLLEHPSAEVRLLALRILRQQSLASLTSDVTPLLKDPHLQVRREAVRFMTKVSHRPPAEILKQWLNDDDFNLRGAALYCAAEQPTVASELLDEKLLQSFMQAGKEARAQAAEALGALNDPLYHHLLEELLKDTDPEVRKRAIASAGRTRAQVFVPLLVGYLGSHSNRKAARQALATYGDAIGQTLGQYLKDDSTEIAVRRAIPRVLSQTNSQKNVQVLLDSLPQCDATTRHQIIKALNKLRARYPQLKFDRRVDQALLEEAHHYYRILAIWRHTNSPASDTSSAAGLLKRALQERLDDHLERIFRLLGLRYSPREMYNAYSATQSNNRSVRANAVEFLDNVLRGDLKHILLPLVDELPTAQVLLNANGLLPVPMRSRRDALNSLATDGDSWLRACALFEIGESGLFEDFYSIIKQAQAEDDTLIRETADLVFERHGQRSENISTD